MKMSNRFEMKKGISNHKTDKNNRFHLKKPELGKETVIHILVSLYLMHFSVMMIGILSAVIKVRQTMVSNNLLYLLSALLFPIFVFLLATKTEYWNYHNHKLFLYKSVVINAIIVSMQPIYTIYWRATVPRISPCPSRIGGRFSNTQYKHMQGSTPLRLHPRLCRAAATRRHSRCARR